MANKQAQFSSDFLKQVEENLLQEATRLEAELAKFSKKNPNVPGDYDATFPEYGDEDDDNAREVAQYTANKPLEITLEKSLRDTRKTLERLKTGDYGICKYCEQPIEEKRLLARPTSGSCVSCKKTLTNEV